MGQNYIFEYLPIISAIFTTLLALFVLYKNPSKRLNQLFFLNCLTFVVWFVATFMMFQATSDAMVVFWDRTVYIGVVFVPVLMYHFGLVFIEKNNGIYSLVLNIGYFLSFIFLLVSRSEYFMSGVFHYEWGVHASAQILHHLFLIYFAIYVAMFLYTILNYYFKLEKSLKKLQTSYVMLAFLLLIILGSTAYLPAYGISILPFAYISGVFFSFLVAWAIMRYRFFGVEFAIRQSSIMAASIVILLLGYGFVNENKNVIADYLLIEPTVVLLFTIIVLAISFQSGKNVIRRILDKMVFVDAIKYEEVRQRLQSDMFSSIELSEIIEQLVGELNHLYKFDGIDIVLKKQEYVLAYSTIAKENCRMSSIAQVADYFKRQSNIISVDEWEYLIDNNTRDRRWSLLTIMKKHNYQIAIPLKSGNEIHGIIFATKPKKVLKIEDYNILDKIAGKASLAVVRVIHYNQALTRITTSLDVNKAQA
jgi:N-terminal 7TM region of histidine kinase